MKKIIFVDDEPNVLGGLQRMLRGVRNQWDMAFVASGSAALERLREARYDIIVTDMRMPVMDGAELLTKVKNLYPHMVRIILSGYSNQPVVLKSVKPAHQYLAKPLEADKLISVLQRASLLSDFLGNDDLAALVSQVESLPSLGEVFQQLQDELESEETSLRKVGEIVSQDMGMSATVLKVVNSAFFGRRRSISSPVEAVQLLGLDVVKALAISAHIFSTFDQARLPGFSVAKLWRHSLNVGSVAKRIALREKMDKRFNDNVFIAGLMHDLGKLVLASQSPVEYSGILELVRRENRLIYEVEKEILGATHAEVGGFLMGLWGLRDDIVHALAFHHRPRDFSDKRLTPMVVTHVANVIEHDLCVINTHYARRYMDWEYLAELQLDQKVSVWLEQERGQLEC